MLTLTSPVETCLHRLPAGAKLGALAALVPALLTLQSPLWLSLALLGVLALHLSGGGRFVLRALVQLRPLWPFGVVLVLWHLWTGDYRSGAALLLRLVTAVMAANLVTMTTRLGDMLAAIESLARPLAPILPPRRLAIAFGMVLRFLPAMSEIMAHLREAWQARSPRRAHWRVLVPALLAALDDAEHAAEALRARGGAP